MALRFREQYSGRAKADCDSSKYDQRSVNSDHVDVFAASRCAKGNPNVSDAASRID